MISVLSLKRQAEQLPEIESILPDKSVSASQRRKLLQIAKRIKQLELKERLILLTHLLAQLKIAILTNDEEKLTHIAAKLLHGDVCNLQGVEEDISKAKEFIGHVELLCKKSYVRPSGMPSKIRTVKKAIVDYNLLHKKIKKEFMEFMGTGSH